MSDNSKLVAQDSAIIRAALSWCEETRSGESHRAKGLRALHRLLAALEAAEADAEHWKTANGDHFAALDAKNRRLREALREISDQMPESVNGVALRMRSTARAALDGGGEMATPCQEPERSGLVDGSGK